jgi:hypothetical protein
MGGGGGGMGGGGMGGGMGGMGGGMGGMGGMSGGMGGMGGMGRMSRTMPPTMGMMMLSRMIMYFCGDPDSWDKRSIMIGMMGGMMGGMGGGMGGMGGGMMGGMGGGMRSVPPTELPSALLQQGQTRKLPTRLVSLNPPDEAAGVKLPADGEPLELGDITDINKDPRVAKAMRRLATDSAATRVTQLVMWNVAAGLDWETIAQMSQKWANRFELALARDFVAHLDSLGEGETGRILFEIVGADTDTEALAAEVRKALRHRRVLGLDAEIGIPARPDAPEVACRVRLSGDDAQSQVFASDAAIQSWIAFGKFSMPLAQENGKFDAARFADSLTEGVLARLVRAQLGKPVKDKSKLLYQIRIDNASPLVLNGIAAVGTTSKDDETPRILAGISLAPRRSMTVTASDEVVKTLGLKKGIRLVALDLSGL